jgi:ankyrin repeat protein
MTDAENALRRALFARDLDASRAAIEAGASVQADPEGVDGPLALAALRKFAAGVELLLERGADPNRVDMTGRTAIFRAATPRIAKLLIAAGASLDVRDRKGGTPLHLAAINHSPMVPFLLAQGLDPDVRDDEGKTALEHACFHLVRKSVEALIDGRELTPEAGARALRAAAGDYGKKAEQIVEILLTHGADPNGLGSPASTPLHAAVHAGPSRVPFLLLAAGADPNVPNDVGATPLHSAAHYCRAEASRAMVEAGGDPHRRCGDRHPDPARRGKSALEIAEACRKRDVIEALTEQP